MHGTMNLKYIFIIKRIGRYHFEEPVGPKLLKEILKKQCKQVFMDWSWSPWPRGL